MPDHQLRRLRATSQLLHHPGPRPVEAVVAHLLAVQGQDLRAAMLAVRARSSGLTAGDVVRALNERALVVSWLCRGTLHLVGSDDHPWLLALTAPVALTASRRRLAQLGFPAGAADHAVTAITRALADGPMVRAAIVEALAEEGIVAAGQAAPHLLRLASMRGLVVQGPVVAGGHAFVRTHDWLGAPPAPDRAVALAELALRYLRGHGPATDTDLATWAGLPLRDARAGLAAIADRLTMDGGLADLRNRAAAEPVPPRLLPAFDPYLLGWKDRGFAVPAAHRRDVHPGGGMLRAVATADGLAVGTWGLRRGEVHIEPFGAVAEDVEVALRAEAADVVRFAPVE